MSKRTKSPGWAAGAEAESGRGPSHVHAPDYTSFGPVSQTTWAVAWTPVQREAWALFDKGFHVVPVVPRTKRPFGNKGSYLYTSRLHPDYIDRLFEEAMLGVVVGRLSRNLAVLDCDTGKASRRFKREFSRRGLRPWSIASASGLKFFWLSDAELANEPTEKDWHVLGNRHVILLPPSVHPTGLILEWKGREGDEPPLIPSYDLDWLGVRPVAERVEEEGESLSRSTRDFLARGAQPGERNRRLFAAACDLAGNDYDFSRASDLLLPVCDRIGYDPSFTWQDARSTIRSAFSKERQPARSVTLWQRAAAFAERFDWRQVKGVRSTTARAVFLACVERCRRSSSPVWRASERELAELSNLTRRTVHTALWQLTSAGLIARASLPDNGNRYAFGEKVLRTCTTNTLEDVVVQVRNKKDAQNDVFCWSGLGGSAQRIYQALSVPNAPTANVAEVARRAGCHRSTASRWLSLDGLPKWGLVKVLPGGRWSAVPFGEADWQGLASKLGTSGHAARRREKHVEERSRHVSELVLAARERETFKVSPS